MSALPAETPEPTIERPAPLAAASAQDQTPDPATSSPSPMRSAPGRVTTPSIAAQASAIPTPAARRLTDPLLLIFAESLGSLEETRIANQNRLRQLTRDEADSDGLERGFGLTLDMPQVAQLDRLVNSLADMEHQATLNLQRQMRAHPLGPWVKATPGVGLKQGARLLAAIGDPYWNTLHDRPRTVSELWAYCGLHVLPAGRMASDTQSGSAGGDQTSDPGQRENATHVTLAGVAAKRRKGVKSNWSGDAKMRAYLVAVSCMKTPQSPYRATYLDRRVHTAVTHPDWTPGHSHNDALRIAAKAVLRDIWREARDMHERTA